VRFLQPPGLVVLYGHPQPLLIHRRFRNPS
jgi:hypothetical protein